MYGSEKVNHAHVCVHVCYLYSIGKRYNNHTQYKVISFHLFHKTSINVVIVENTDGYDK